MSQVKNIAVVGVTGTVGTYIVDALLKTGKHTVTAITREASTAVIPEGVKVAKVNYDDHASLVAALRDQEVLIITMNPRAPADTQLKLVEAAADAGVAYVMPNNWGIDQTNEEVATAVHLGGPFRAVRDRIEELGKSSWISLVSGFWYEYSLGGSANRYGFDFGARSVVFFDDGKQAIDTTTLPQSGLAVARLLSLPVNKSGNEPALSDFKNKQVYVSSFRVSQRDMFESVLRVTNTKAEDWKVSYENSKERFEGGVKALQSGDIMGFARLLYSRVFYPDGSGVFGTKHPLHNELLGLPKEDIDEFTKKAIHWGTTRN